MDGTTPAPERDRIFADFRSGAITVLCACAVVDEGLDVPEATCLQLLRPTRSLRLYRQLIGRVLRPAEGKEEAIIIDHGGSVGDTCHYLMTMLTGHCMKRLRLYVPKTAK